MVAMVNTHRLRVVSLKATTQKEKAVCYEGWIHDRLGGECDIPLFATDSRSELCNPGALEVVNTFFRRSKDRKTRDELRSGREREQTCCPNGPGLSLYTPLPAQRQRVGSVTVNPKGIKRRIDVN